MRIAAAAKLRHLMSQPRLVSDLFHSKAPFKLCKIYISAEKNTKAVRNAVTTRFDLQKLTSVAFGAYDFSIRAIAIRQIRTGLREQCSLLGVDEIFLRTMAAGCLNILADISVSKLMEPIVFELQLEAASLFEDLVLFEKSIHASLGIGSTEHLDLKPLLLFLLQSNCADNYLHVGGCIPKDILLLKVIRIISIWSLSDDVWESLSSEHKCSSIVPEFLREHFGVVELSPGHLALVDEAYKHYTWSAVVNRPGGSLNLSEKASLGKYLGFVFANYLKCRSNITLKL